MSGEYFFEWVQIALIIAAFFLGSWLMKVERKQTKPVDNSGFYVPKLTALIAVLLMYLSIRSQLIAEVIIHLYAGDYASWALGSAIDRYESNEDKGWAFKLGTILFLVYAFLLGAYGARRKAGYLYGALALMIFVESSGLARAGVLLAITALLVELLIRKNKTLIDMRTVSYVKISLLVFLGLLAIFLFSAYFRVADKDDVLSILIDKAQSYTVAMYQALLIWMRDTDAYGSGLGYFTFTAIYKMMGVEVVQGFYAPVTTEYGVTNIYTSLRGFLSDFGMALTVAVFFMFGAILAYYSYVRMRFSGYMSVRAILYILIFNLYSPFLFTTVFAAFVISGILIYLFKEKHALLHRG